MTDSGTSHYAESIHAWAEALDAHHALDSHPLTDQASLPAAEATHHGSRGREFDPAHQSLPFAD